MNNIRLWVGLVIIFLGIPLFGLAVSQLMANNYLEIANESANSKNVELSVDHIPSIGTTNTVVELTHQDIAEFCSRGSLLENFGGFCTYYTGNKYLGYLSIFTIIFSLVSILFIFALGRISAKNRNILFYLFRCGLFFSQISSAVLVACNAIILLASIYIAEPYYIGRLHVIFIGLAALAAVIAVYDVFSHAMEPPVKAEARVFGRVLSKEMNPRLWKFVEMIASRLGSSLPDTIVAGLDSTFFVTEADVICLDGRVSGRTLYLSLPFCRILSESEIKAVIGHELGHFVGEDTRWSRRFYPIYRGAFNSINSLSVQKLSDVALLPALLFMNLFMGSFERAEKRIGRERELCADKAGVESSSSNDMAIALLKLHLYENIWDDMFIKISENLHNEAEINNLSLDFRDACEKIPSDWMSNEIGQRHTAHPTDSHPPLQERLSSIGIHLSTVYSDRLLLGGKKMAIELFNNPTELEEMLSLEYCRIFKKKSC